MHGLLRDPAVAGRRGARWRRVGGRRAGHAGHCGGGGGGGRVGLVAAGAAAQRRRVRRRRGLFVRRPGSGERCRGGAGGGSLGAVVGFLETGRSRPSRQIVLRLGEALGVWLRERNRLLEAAGCPPPTHRPIWTVASWPRTSPRSTGCWRPSSPTRRWSSICTATWYAPTAPADACWAMTSSASTWSAGSWPIRPPARPSPTGPRSLGRPGPAP